MNIETLLKGFLADNISKIEVPAQYGAVHEVSGHLCIAKVSKKTTGYFTNFTFYI